MNATGDSLLQDRFRQLADTVDDSDWNDVVSRAAGLGRQRWSLNGRRVAVLAGIAFALGVGATVVSGAPLLGLGAASTTPGPVAVERQLPNGTIGWLFRHEPRGQSLAAAQIAVGSLVGSHWQPVRFARVLTPDPALNTRIVVSLIGKRGRNVCMTVIDRDSGGGGCAVGLLLRPFSVMTSGRMEHGRTLITLAGLASDDVASIKLFLGHGAARRVPLKDNAFYVRLSRPDLPANLVAYDDQGRVIGTDQSVNLAAGSLTGP